MKAERYHGIYSSKKRKVNSRGEAAEHAGNPRSCGNTADRQHLQPNRRFFFSSKLTLDCQKDYITMLKLYRL